MYARIAFSSRPTVFTKYPRAQKCCPTKFRFRSPYVRARWIALLPLMYPTTCETAYFGGMDINICTWSGIKCPSRSSTPVAPQADEIRRRDVFSNADLAQRRFMLVDPANRLV